MSYEFDAEAVARFAKLALSCVHKEYPNKISHILNSDADVRPPRKLTPAFYGCFDWHSSVHGHWLLARLARIFPEADFAVSARKALAQSLTTENIKIEAEYLCAEGRASFERPYGLAWLLQLATELREWSDPQSQELSANLSPLEEAVLRQLKRWLPKLPCAVRSGEHSQTAFAVGLMVDYARAFGDEAFSEMLFSKARQFYLSDRNAPLEYEPSGEDFLSPCMAEADLMRRILPEHDFVSWLRGFMPQISTDGDASWFKPAVSPDPSDPKLAHLDGLNLSRAWMLDGIASALPDGDDRRASLTAVMAAHRSAGLAAVTGEHYEGGHWLGTFAVYLVTRRGLRDER